MPRTCSRIGCSRKPCCKAARSQPQATIIEMSSGGMYNAPLTLDYMGMKDPKKYNGVYAYAVHKRGQAELVKYWQRRHGASGLRCYVMHPGWADTDGVKTAMPNFRRRLRQRAARFCARCGHRAVARGDASIACRAGSVLVRSRAARRACVSADDGEQVHGGGSRGVSGEGSGQRERNNSRQTQRAPRCRQSNPFSAWRPWRSWRESPKAASRASARFPRPRDPTCPA